MTAAPGRWVLASGNSGKLHEIQALLAGSGIEIIAQRDLGVHSAEETGATFVENALLKARHAALETGLPAIADDSGLEVLHLDGAPGVLSARYAGEHGDDAANNAKLLRELSGVSTEARGARFVCALCLCQPDGTPVIEVFGDAHGRILEEAKGTRDFGYDPLFLFTEPGFAETNRGFAELEPSEKSAISHRGRALQKLAAALSGLPS